MQASVLAPPVKKKIDELIQQLELSETTEEAHTLLASAFNEAFGKILLPPSVVEKLKSRLEEKSSEICGLQEPTDSTTQSD